MGQKKARKGRYILRHFLYKHLNLILHASTCRWERCLLASVKLFNPASDVINFVLLKAEEKISLHVALGGVFSKK